jgi:hypothetical protein
MHRASSRNLVTGEGRHLSLHSRRRCGEVALHTVHPRGTEPHDMHIYRLFCEDNEWKWSHVRCTKLHFEITCTWMLRFNHSSSWRCFSRMSNSRGRERNLLFIDVTKVQWNWILDPEIEALSRSGIGVYLWQFTPSKYHPISIIPWRRRDVKQAIDCLQQTQEHGFMLEVLETVALNVTWNGLTMTRSEMCNVTASFTFSDLC